MKIAFEKLNPAVRRKIEDALEDQRRYERIVELRKTKSLQEIGDAMGISKQRVDQILREGAAQ